MTHCDTASTFGAGVNEKVHLDSHYRPETHMKRITEVIDSLN